MGRFYPWVDTPTSLNILDVDAFETDSQREEGFKSGQAASSIRINTGLRQANLVVAALMETLLPSSTLNVGSSVAQVSAELLPALKAVFAPYVVTITADTTTAGWTGTAGNYTKTITASTHGKGLYPSVEMFVSGDRYYDDYNINFTNGTITLKSAALVALTVVIRE